MADLRSQIHQTDRLQKILRQPISISRRKRHISLINLEGRSSV